MISASHVSIFIGDRALVRDASFVVDKGMRIGLVGRNGAGKTTTLKLLAGIAHTEGAIEYQGDVHSHGTVAYLSQDPDAAQGEKTGRERILSVRGLDNLARKITQAEHLMSTTEGDQLAKAMERYTRLDHEFEMKGGWAANSEAMHIGANLGLDKETLLQPLQTLSGGQRRRVELARVLFSQSDILLLDEPTNHLDHDSIVWLRQYLQNYSGGFLMITHNVDLLEDTVNKVFYIDSQRRTLDIYHTTWHHYLRQREEAELRRKKERDNALRKAQQLKEQGEKMRAKATKAVAAQQMLKRAEKLLTETAEATSYEKVARLRFPQPAPCGKVPLTATGLTKSYGDNIVFIDLNLAVDRGSKIVVLGCNGAGKTTLLRLLYNLEDADEGQVHPGHGLELGYYAQEHELLDPHASVYENMAAAAPEFDETHVRNVLGQFLFSGDDVDKPASVLSGGEKTRLSLATLVVSRANVLLLDEPTNNLDPASREEILYALNTYEGAVVLVTHDPGAVKALHPDRVLLLPDGDEDYWSDDYADFITLK
ncbi:MAG: ABC-F family ATP-binding cassette domain-containing protein [Actinomycetaceae bacterium]|nr:ABC-F family ATP-binding cassette domain-containing protein [Actinomycetaceae bacterium]